MYQDQVYNTVLGFLRSEADAEDVAQEVFVAVYRTIDGFRGEAKLSTWVYRIAVSKSLGWLRKANRKKRLGMLTRLLGHQNDPGLAVTGSFHPGVLLENKEKAAVLFAAIDRLPEKQRVAFTLNKVEGLAYREIMEVMGLSLAAVESLLHRARKNLQKSLYQYYESMNQ